MSWRSFRAKVLRNPREAFRGDLRMAALGLFVVFIGSVLAGDGWYGGAPLLGTIVFFIGAAVIITGLFLAIANITIRLRTRYGKHTDSG